MRRLKDVMLCAFTLAVFFSLIVALDVATGVPLSYGVPLAALFALAPYAFVLARGLTARQPQRVRRASSGAPTSGRETTPSIASAAVRHREGREDLDEDFRPCIIHSVIFLEPEAGYAGISHEATPPAAA